MYMLEVRVRGTVGAETFHFPTIEKVLDYIYMVEGETLLPEYRAEFQRKAPGTQDIKSLQIKPYLFFLWEIGSGKGAIRYALSYCRISTRKHVRWTFPKLSKYWGTVYGAPKDRVELPQTAPFSFTDYIDSREAGVN